VLNLLKICAVSDLHGKTFLIPKCNVLAIAGDISVKGDGFWFLRQFLPFLEDNKHKFDMCLVVFGNHDDSIQLSDVYKDDVPDYVKILNNTAFTYKGVKFFGSPFTIQSPEIIESMTAFDDDTLGTFYADIPFDTDFLITHMPPYGIGDTVINQDYHLGSQNLLARVWCVKPKVHVFGHIHTGKKYTEVNGTKFYNVSLLNENYNLVYKPTIINLA